MDVDQLSAKTPEIILKQVFGFSEFRPLQRQIIESLLAGRNNLVLMPTGGGKSICFQIPALLRPGVGIVVSPLISLMQDQVSALQANGVAAAYFNSSLSYQQSQQVLNRLHNRQLDLLYIAPERLVSETFLERLDHIQLALFAIDEAHCISQWGPDFRPEYKQFQVLRDRYPTVPVIALTATADRPTQQDIRECLRLQTADFHLDSFNRPNIHYTVLEKHKPFQQILNFLENNLHNSGIIYCLSRRRVEEVAEMLLAKSFQAAAYHAGMSSDKRQRIQNSFQKDDIQIIVATVAFGMGIDKSNVRFVIHYDLPKNIESYYQETGRAGRDGLPAHALLLYGLADMALVRGLIDKNANEVQRRIESHKLNAMMSFAEAQTCRRQVLLNYFDENLAEDCKNCDICQNPPETYDATIDVRKALSCVFRAGQRFGVGHIIDILRGAEKERIKQLGHHRLSTYGIGENLSHEAWHSIFRQLIHQGYLEQDLANYSVLKLTEKSRPVLKGELQLILAKPRIKIIKNSEIKVKSSETKKSAKRKSVIDFNYDTALFERLRQLRKKIADRSSIPPYMVFSDITLALMAAEVPTNESSLLSISGVGDFKLKTYGAEFIAEIKCFIGNGVIL